MTERRIRDELVVISAAAASPTGRQRRERSYIAVAELASQPFDATDADDSVRCVVLTGALMLFSAIVNS